MAIKLRSTLISEASGARSGATGFWEHVRRSADPSSASAQSAGIVPLSRRLLALTAALAELLLVVFVSGILVAAVRGIPGNPTPTDLQQPRWQGLGPLELSPERGRYALTFSLAENRTTQLSIPLARFTTPDVGYIHGHYVSLFQPGMSVFLLPGYLIGRAHNLAQLGTYLVVTLFALANAWLIRLIAVHLGASRLAGWLGSFTFLFASPAFVYAVSLFQHHLTLFMLLCPTYLLLRWRSPLVVALTWLMYGLAIFVDYPNALLFAPIAVLAVSRMISVSHSGPLARVYLSRWSARAQDSTAWCTISLKLRTALTASAFLLPMVVLLWFNFQSYDNPLQLSSTVPTVKAIDAQGLPTLPKDLGSTSVEAMLRPETQNKSVGNFFDTRLLLQGLYIHILSPDRGVLYFTPVMLFGILGAWFLARKKAKELVLLLTVIGLDLTLYSMWDDPWGGWAFGSRYLVPVYAMLAILIAVGLSHVRKSKMLFGLFGLALLYSLGVNTLGALTSSSNPPQAEVAAVSRLSNQVELYTWQRNWEFLRDKGSKSAVYQTIAAGHVSPVGYYWLLTGALALPCVGMLGLLYVNRPSWKESR